MSRFAWNLLSLYEVSTYRLEVDFDIMKLRISNVARMKINTKLIIDTRDIVKILTNSATQCLLGEILWQFSENIKCEQFLHFKYKWVKQI